MLLSACVPVVDPARLPPPVAPPAAMLTPPPLIPLDRLEVAPPERVGLATTLPATLDSLVNAGIADGAAPGAALAVGRHGRLVHMRGYGSTTDVPEGPAVTDSTIWDLASLTKVVATTTAAMILEEEGRLNLDQPVSVYLPELNDPAKATITVRMLLSHSGGLEAFAPLYQTLRGPEAFLRAINERPLQYAPGTRAIYSDWDMILLQLVVERISGESLPAFTRRRIFEPLGLRETLFLPDPALLPRIAPTEVDRVRGRIHGSVHDPNAWAMGGVAGHAGLFSSARDLAVFAQMLLNGGSYGGVRIVRPETLARWTAPQRAGSSRALGWDTPSGESSAGRYFSPRSFGHTGYTGTSLWIDPERGIFVVLLTNRVYYTSANQRQGPLRRAVADAVQGAVLDAPLVGWEQIREQGTANR